MCAQPFATRWMVIALFAFFYIWKYKNHFFNWSCLIDLSKPEETFFCETEHLHICFSVVYWTHQQAAAAEHKNPNLFMRKTAVNSLFISLLRSRTLDSVSYLCDDFLNKHKLLIIEEFEAGFAYTYSREPNLYFTF